MVNQPPRDTPPPPKLTTVDAAQDRANRAAIRKAVKALEEAAARLLSDEYRSVSVRLVRNRGLITGIHVLPEIHVS